MSERKNIKRNKTRPHAKDLPFHSSIQRNYGKIKQKVEQPCLWNFIINPRLNNKTIMKETKKGESYRIGYIRGYEEASKAYGGCKNCYGKGYATVRVQAASRGKIWQLPHIKFCKCSRGQQLEKEFDAIIKP